MSTKKAGGWLAFMGSGAIAYALVFWEGFWPLGRLIAGWYAIFVIVIAVVTGITVLSIKWGRLKSRSDFWDFFTF